MNRDLHANATELADLLTQHALGLLARDEAAAVEQHATTCAECHAELASLRAVADKFVDWPTDVVRAPRPLWDRIAASVGIAPEIVPAPPPPATPALPGWITAAPGIDYMLLTEDTSAHRVSLLVRLAPGASYPPHRHAGVEELFLLNGELYIEDRKLLPGDYNRGEPGTGDQRVWSETGCSCILITSSRDALG